MSATRPAGIPHVHRMLTAFGETKNLHAWSMDPRCPVNYDALYNRVVLAGWTAERAITQPRRAYRTARDPQRLQELAERRQAEVRDVVQARRDAYVAKKLARQRERAEHRRGRSCQQCGETFDANTYNQMYCSRACGQRHHHEQRLKDPQWRARQRQLRQLWRARRRALHQEA